MLDQMAGGLVAALEEIGSIATFVEGARHRPAAYLPSLCRVPTAYSGPHSYLAPWRLCHDYPGAWETPGGALGVADRLVRPDVLLMPPSG
ncbi:MAG: hypothetical protein ACE5GE_16760, partial [Phycisphaerae bacterium]